MDASAVIDLMRIVKTVLNLTSSKSVASNWEALIYGPSRHSQG